MKKETIFMVLAIIFVVGLVISNIVSPKMVNILGFITPIGVFLYPLTFAITDVISEVWGKQKAQFVVRLGLLGALTSSLLLYLMTIIPASELYQFSNEFSIVLGSVPRITFASILAYFISQTHDVWAFHFWKKLTKSKHLWLRNNLSTMVSQLLDTLIFIWIAFGFVYPASVVWGMVLTQYVIKILIAGLDTPIVYLLVKKITGKWTVKEFEYYG